MPCKHGVRVDQRCERCTEEKEERKRISDRLGVLVIEPPSPIRAALDAQAKRHAEDVALARRVVEACAVKARGAVRHSQQTTDQCRNEVEEAVLTLDVEALVGRKP